jgi:hypothetical protein
MAQFLRESGGGRERRLEPLGAPRHLLQLAMPAAAHRQRRPCSGPSLFTHPLTDPPSCSSSSSSSLLTTTRNQHICSRLCTVQCADSPVALSLSARLAFGRTRTKKTETNKKRTHFHPSGIGSSASESVHAHRRTSAGQPCSPKRAQSTDPSEHLWLRSTCDSP